MRHTEMSPDDTDVIAAAVTESRPWTDDRVSSGAACIVDLDNLLNRGIDKSNGTRRPRAQLNVTKFASELRKRGVVRGAMCQNWEFNLLEQRLWTALGFDTIATRANCDPRAMIAAIDFVEDGCRDIVLVTGDGDYVEVVQAIRHCGARVEVWARRASTARALIEAADAVRYIDEFLRTPPPPDVAIALAA